MMKIVVPIWFLLLQLLIPCAGNAQSLPRMGGVRTNSIYGTQGSGNVYGLRARQRNLSGVSRQHNILTMRRWRDSTLMGVAGTSRIYARGWSGALFNRGNGSRRYF